MIDKQAPTVYDYKKTRHSNLSQDLRRKKGSQQP